MSNVSTPDNARETQFEQLMREYKTEILRICYFYLMDQSLAEDAMQDTFEKVWRNISRFEQRNGCSLKTWITRIAINTCKDYLRSSWFKRRNIVQSLEEIPPTLIPSTQDSIDIFLDVLILPEKYKSAILLYHYQSMTAGDAAQALNISRVTFSRRLNKAYALLRLPYVEETDEASTESNG